ncbi:MAG: hypothetical protein NTY22_04665, partial [Proteobacteria bacterium]|nr:hypothetical protein [Pseudomonadota bacterium]
LMSGFSSLLISKHTISVDIAKFRTENLSANKEGRQVAWVNSAFTYSNKLKDSFVNSKADIRLIEDIAILNER